jgi:hypothetical protein
MKPAHFQSVLAAFAIVGTFLAPAPKCLAGDGDSCSKECPGYWSNCGVCRCCDRCCCFCDKLCQFRLIDGCTKCAWSRTWNAPNALATPLRQYYIPRPPQCCWCNGCNGGMAGPGGATWEMSADTNCPSRMTLASTDISPESAVVISPAQSERLGKVPNELDVVGPIGGAAPSRAAAPGR